MRRELRLAVALLFGVAPGLCAQERDSAAPAATISPADVKAIWEAVLDDYRRGKRDTEVDMLRGATRVSGYAVGTFRRGGPPRVLRGTSPPDAAQDTAWLTQLIAADLIERACTDPVISGCPTAHVTLFLTLGSPERAPEDRATVLVHERGVDPAVCRMRSVMMGEFVRLFTVERKPEGWRVRSAKGVGGATMRCDPGVPD